jgi:hemoglobin
MSTNGGPSHHIAQSRAAFDEVAAELGRSLHHFKVPEREKGEVPTAFAAHKSEVMEGSLLQAV